MIVIPILIAVICIGVVLALVRVRIYNDILEGKNLTREEREDAIAAYEKGEKIKNIAKRYGVTYSYIHQITYHMRLIQREKQLYQPHCQCCRLADHDKDYIAIGCRYDSYYGRKRMCSPKECKEWKK